MLSNHFKTVFRDLPRNKLYWAVNSFGLALGVGVTLLLYQFISYEFSYDRFYQHEDHLYRIQAQVKLPDREMHTIRTSYLMSAALKASVPQVALAAGVQSTQITLEFEENKIIDQPMHFAHPDIAGILELDFLEGNPDQHLQHPNSAILTEKLALKVFGKSSDLIGQFVKINDHFNGQSEVQIMGIVKDLPANSHFSSQGFISMNTLDPRNFNWALTNCETYVRLNADSDMVSFAQSLNSIIEKHGVNPDNGFRTVTEYEAFPIRDIYLSDDPQQMGKGNKRIIIGFLIFGLLILLIACTNYMNLAAARYTQKAKQAGIRKVIGASKHQIVMQAMAEAMVISLIAIFLGGFLAETGSILFNRITDKPLSIGFIRNPQLILAFAAFTLFVAFLSNLYPALQLSRVKISPALKGNMSAGRGGKRFRQILIALQFAISGGLIVTTLVIHRQMSYINSKDLGYNPNDVLIVEMPRNPSNARQFRQMLAANPNITTAGLSTVPSGGFRHMRKLSALSSEGEQVVENTSYMQIDQHFTLAMELELLNGKSLDGPNAPLQAMVNESWVKRMGWSNPLEHTIGIFNYQTGQTDRHAQVVGVVKDFNQMNLFNKIEPMVFFELDLFSNRQHFLHIRLASEQTSETINYIKESYLGIEENQIYNGYFLEDTIAKDYAQIKTQDQINFILTTLSIIVACIGLLGLAFFSVKIRTKEIAIRKVLGSSILNLVKVLSKEFVLILIAAYVIAFPVASVIMNNWLDQFAYRIHIGPDLFLLALISTASISLITIAYQSIRTSQIDPAQTLKAE